MTSAPLPGPRLLSPWWSALAWLALGAGFFFGINRGEFLQMIFLMPGGLGFAVLHADREEYDPATRRRRPRDDYGWYRARRRTVKVAVIMLALAAIGRLFEMIA